MEESCLGEYVELEVDRHRIVISAAPATRQDHPDQPREDEISRLYAELKALMAQPAAEQAEEEIRTRFTRLRQLQLEEADAMEAKFVSSRHLAPGRGWKALERAHKILNEDPAANDEASGPED